MRKAIVGIGALCGVVSLALAYDPATGLIDKAHIALLVPFIVLNLWTMVHADE